MNVPVADVDLAPWIPVAVAFAVSTFTSLGGVSGAFLLMPFQVSALGLAAPSASATNHLYNVIATPGGVWRYAREGRLLWPLALVMVAGAIPGVWLGAWLRIRFFAEPAHFKLFLAAVLLYLGVRLLLDARRGRDVQAAGDITLRERSLRRLAYQFAGAHYAVHTAGLGVLSLGVGIIGGVYGIGGGALMAPFLVSVFRLPVHTIAGATLAATFATSLAAVAGYTVLSNETSAAPDWALGLLFGLGGLAGTYLGAQLQQRVPERAIKLVLAACCGGIAASYFATA